MSFLDRFKSLGRAVQEATQTIHGNIGELRLAITAKASERDQARDGTLPPAEVIAKYSAWVDEFAAYQSKEGGAGLVRRFGSPPSQTYNVGAPWGPDTAVTWGFLCLFAGATLKATFAELVRSTEYTPGPPAAERSAIVVRLEAELAALEEQEEALVDEAAAAGVVIEHRLEVTERRAAEQAQRERTARAAATENRPAREAAVDQRHARRASPSAYITGTGRD